MDYNKDKLKKDKDIQDEKQSKVTVTLMSCKVKSVEKRTLPFAKHCVTILKLPDRSEKRPNPCKTRASSSKDTPDSPLRDSPSTAEDPHAVKVNRDICFIFIEIRHQHL